MIINACLILVCILLSIIIGYIWRELENVKNGVEKLLITMFQILEEDDEDEDN